MRRTLATVAVAGLVAGVAAAEAQEPETSPTPTQTETAPTGPTQPGPTPTEPDGPPGPQPGPPAPASGPTPPATAAPAPSDVPPGAPVAPGAPAAPAETVPGVVDLADQPVAREPGSVRGPGADDRRGTRESRRERPTRRERRRARKAAAERAADRAELARATDDALGPLAVLPVSPFGRPIPNLLIERFRIPPFLLSIYQAAGVQYGVRWEILAAINEIETDYGRNLDVSSAGAQGWMQFMPATWEAYGVDANDDGVRDPYNPVDAIFAAARYLDASGYSEDVRGAIFAYNRADWYVRSVVDRARLISALPAELVGSLTGLTEGRFPVAADASYATRATPAALDGEARTVVSEGSELRRELEVRADSGSPVVAVQDGRVTRIGSSPELGRFLQLRDVYGNTYTYADLGSVADTFLTPRGTPGVESAAPAESEAEALGRVPDGLPLRPAGSVGPREAAEEPRSVDPDGPDATAPTVASGAVAPGVDGPGAPADSELRGNLEAARAAGVAPAGPGADAGPTSARAAARVTVKASELLAAQRRALQRAIVVGPSAAPAPAPVADPLVPDDGARMTPGAAVVPAPSVAPGASDEAPGRTVYTPYQRRLLGGLDRKDVRARPLQVGSTVVGGTVLGRIGKGETPHLRFRIRPAGEGTPLIDPTPILDGWRLLDSTSIYRSTGRSALEPQGSGVGRILLETKERLVRRVLADPDIELYACGRRDVAAGLIDRRVLAALAFLAEEGLKPTVSSLRCGHGRLTSSGNVSEHTTGTAVDIAAINGTTITGATQGPGSVTEHTLRKLLTLQGTMKPHQIISLRSVPGTDNTLALPDHDDHIHVGWTPQPGATGPAVDGAVGGALRGSDWEKLMARLNVIENPFVAAEPSSGALPVERKKRR